MSGAAYLAGKAALRAGAGLVTVACPASVERVLEIKTTCVMTRGLPETEAGSLAAAAAEPLRGLRAGRSALAAGPGLSRGEEALGLVRDLVAELGPDDPPLVLDADGLNAFEGRAGELTAAGGRLVLTPHPGEFRRLSGCSREDLAGDRRAATLGAFVEETGVTTLLKGHRTLVASPGVEATYVNETGNPGMATAGSGDVLTGVVVGLLAQGLGPHDAACLGAYVHGLAGDAAARRVGWAALIASDLLDGLCEVLPGLEPRP
jgi:NAD(P)H-hydrate epimerase